MPLINTSALEMDLAWQFTAVAPPGVWDTDLGTEIDPNLVWPHEITWLPNNYCDVSTTDLEITTGFFDRTSYPVTFVMTNGTAYKPATSTETKIPLRIALSANPAHNATTLRVSDGNGEPVRVELLNVLGAAVEQYWMDGTRSDLPIDVSGMSSGRYVLRTTQLGNEPKTLMLNIQH
jgi:hypothetical protein